MPRPPREPAPLPILRQSANREEGIAAFEADLEATAETFAADRDKGKLAAINAVILFLDDGGLPKQWIAPFRAIRDDLVDGGRKPGELKRRDWVVRAWIGAALDALISQRGGDEERAAGEVAMAVNKQHGVVQEADGSPVWLTGAWVIELRTRLLRQKSEARGKPRANPKAAVLFDYYRQLWLQEDVLKLLKEHLAGRT